MKKVLTALFIGCWVIGVSYAITMMHSWHYVDLSPSSTEDFKLASILPEVKDHGVVHFLTPKCSCSKSIFEHLNSRGPLGKTVASEVVILIDDDKEEFLKPLKKNGFQVYNYSTAQMKDEFSTSIKGVPLLVIYNKSKDVRYVGGYSDASITPLTQINIKNYLLTLNEGRKIASKPVIGCSVSKEYQAILDPLGLKYKKEN
ncbi:hypothetical protein [Halobacteriovorax sp. HLS]|uniref:DUF6436 domain-containing protein n=1 Tax=Halobacteriovorax sp. HLS TaxID=2234000 RepID=UPI000FDB5940|nr:hypothetical protein [Halobacteriovorax sp. HLS]